MIKKEVHAVIDGWSEDEKGAALGGILSDMVMKWGYAKTMAICELACALVVQIKQTAGK